MILRRLLAAVLAPVVLATGLAAAVHAHLPRFEARSGVTADIGASVHDAGSCPVCRLAHESSPAASTYAGIAGIACSGRPVESVPSLAIEVTLDHGRSPRAPPRLPLV